MSALDFPNNPTNGQVFTSAGKTWVYSTASSSWNNLTGTGFTGSRGFTGSVGFTGSASTVPGPTGFTGSVGSTGFTGSASTVPGPTGPTGFTGSAGPIAGSNTQIIYNNSGNAAGSANLVFNQTTTRVGIGTSSPDYTLSVAGTTETTGVKEGVFTVTDGSTVNLDPNNGSIQTWTLGANRTPGQSNWATGQSITLLVDDGSAHTITWSTLAVVWKTDGGTAPTLELTGFTVIVLWKVGTTIYGARVGDA
jgi:hypothetical protein